MSKSIMYLIIRFFNAEGTVLSCRSYAIVLLFLLAPLLLNGQEMKVKVEVITNQQVGDVFKDARGLIYAIPLAEPEIILRHDGQRTIRLGRSEDNGEGLELPKGFEHSHVLKITDGEMLSVSNPTKQVLRLDLHDLTTRIFDFTEVGLYGEILSLGHSNTADKWISVGLQNDSLRVFEWGESGTDRSFYLYSGFFVKDARHEVFGDTLLVSVYPESTRLYLLSGELIKIFLDVDIINTTNVRRKKDKTYLSELRKLPDGGIYATSYWHKPSLLRFNRKDLKFYSHEHALPKGDHRLVSIPIVDSLGNHLYAGGDGYLQRIFTFVNAEGKATHLGEALQDAILGNRHQNTWTPFVTDDLTQTLWAASEDRGLLKISFLRERIKSFWENFGFHWPLAYEGGNSIMVASYYNSLFRLGETEGHEELYGTTTWYLNRTPGAISGVKALMYGPEGDIWGNDTIGLYRIDTATNLAWELPIPEPIDFTWSILSNSRIIVPVTDGRVFTAVPPYDSLETIPPGNLPDFDKIFSIHEGTEGNLWLGTDKGLYFGNIDGVTPWERQLNELAEGLIVYHWYTGEQDQWWLSTNQGWILFDAGTKRILRRYTTEDGLAHNDVRATIFVKGFFWVATRGGLSRFHPEKQSFRTISFEEGFSSQKLTVGAVYAPGANLLGFGTERGFNYFYPEDLMDDPAPLVGISSLTYFDRQLASNVKSVKMGYAGQWIDLPANNRSLQVDLFLNDLREPKGHNFAYRFSPEIEWTEINNQSELLFTTLPAGKHQIEIIGRTGYSPWSDPIRVNVRVAAFFYQTWWFRLCLASLVFGLTGAWIIRLRREQGKLREMVEARTATIRRDKEIIEQQAESMIELDAAKTRFFANISHELRTPLTVIKGFANESRKNITSLTKTHLAESMGLISSNSDRLLHLVNQLLELGKLEAGKLTPRYRRTDVRPELDLILASFEVVAKEKDLHLRHGIDFRSLEADLDSDKFLKIIYNLLSNAIKFTPEGGQVFITATNTAAEILKIEIKDTGIGIEQELLESIFERFSQVDDGLSRKAEGTGIGLNLSRELAELMGGTLTVESSINEGSSFKLLLPRWQEVQESQTIETDLVTSAFLPFEHLVTSVSDVPEILGEEHLPLVLIVEDNADIIAYLRLCLGDNYRTITARNGKEGVATAREEIPDLILSDVMMPVMDGLELCRILKNDERTSHVPIILLTALSSVENRIAGLRQGADAYLSKPFSKEELIVQVENLREGRERLSRFFLPSTISVPDPPPSDPEADYHRVENEFLNKLTGLIENRLDDPKLRTEDLAQCVQLSQSQLWRKIKAVTGLTTNEFVSRYRLQRAAKLLNEGKLSVSEVAYKVGFSDPSYFTKKFTKEFGTTPSGFLRGNTK